MDRREFMAIVTGSTALFSVAGVQSCQALGPKLQLPEGVGGVLNFVMEFEDPHYGIMSTACAVDGKSPEAYAKDIEMRTFTSTRMFGPYIRMKGLMAGFRFAKEPVSKTRVLKWTKLETETTLWLGQFWATYLKFGRDDLISLVEGPSDINRTCGVEFEA